MTDTTITAIRATLLRVPWPQTPWLKGHAFGPMREFLVLDVETRGGIAGMGYLFLFRPAMRSIANRSSRRFWTRGPQVPRNVLKPVAQSAPITLPAHVRMGRGSSVAFQPSRFSRCPRNSSIEAKRKTPSGSGVSTEPSANSV